MDNLENIPNLNQNRNTVIEPTVEHKNAEKLVNTLDMNAANELDKKVTIVASIFVLLLGVGTGFFLSRYTTPQNTGTVASATDENVTAEEEQATDEVVLIGEGILVDGGVDGQGRYTLQVENGDDIALVSSLILLESFIEKEVEIWGENISQTDELQLVDVSRVKVLK